MKAESAGQPAVAAPAQGMADARPWATLLVTTAIQALVSLAALAIPVLASLVGASLGWASSQLAGGAAAAVYAGAIVSTLMAGPLVLRWGAIRISQMGLLLCVVGLLLAGSGWVLLLFVGAFVIGLGYGPITPASSHLLIRSTPAHRMSLVFSIKQTGVPLGGLLAGAVAPGLGVWLGWQAALMWLSLPCLGLALASQGLRRRLDTDLNPLAPAFQWRRVVDPLRMVLQHAALKRLALCSMLFAMVQLSVAAYSVSYLSDELGLNLVSAGLLLSVAQAGGVLGRVGWGYVADRWLGARRTLMLLSATMAVCALGMSVLWVGAPMALLMVLMALFGAVAIGWNGVYLAEVARAAPTGQAGTATGGTLTFTFFGSIAGPVGLGGVIALADSMAAAYAAVVLPLLVACGVLGRGRRAEPLQQATRRP